VIDVSVTPQDEKIMNRIMNLLEKAELGMTATEVAKALHINRNTARFWLKTMAISGMIKSVTKGRSVIYYVKKDTT